MNKYQFFVDNKGKAERIIDSCETIKQIISARKYVRLLDERLNELFKYDYKMLHNVWTEIQVLEHRLERKIKKVKNT